MIAGEDVGQHPAFGITLGLRAKFGPERVVDTPISESAILGLADQIVVMQSGRILDLGPHEDLLARCGLYCRLYQVQFEDLGKGTVSPLAA